MADSFHFLPGTAPLLVSMPHVGTDIPQALQARMQPVAQVRADTDWHLEQLYDFLGALGASVIIARTSRYVIDLNRDPDNRALYPGANNTELCPTSTFDSEPLYGPGAAPSEAEIAARRETYWRPYHHQLQTELKRLKAQHGHAVLWDAHSIRSEVPRFFAGRLPDLNLGTGGGTTATEALSHRLEQIATSSGYSTVLNGRFKGGYITRAYGKPAEGIQAVQLELSQITYMDEAAPFAFRAERASHLRPTLRKLLEATLA